MSYSIKVKSHSGDTTLFYNDTLSLDLAVDNPLNIPITVKPDLLISINGKTQDVELPSFEKNYIIDSKSTKIINILNTKITKDFPHGNYLIIVSCTSDIESTNVYDSCHVFIDPRKYTIAGRGIFKKTDKLDKILVWGHYGLICGSDVGEGSSYRTPNEFRTVIRKIKEIWHNGTLAFRSWLVGDGTSPHTVFPWLKLSNGQYDLSKFNQSYFDRFESFLEIARQENVLMFLDLFDHYTMSFPSTWMAHVLYPNNNIQRTYGLRVDTTAFPYFYTYKNTDFINFQKSYVAKVVNICKNYDNVILSTGNEMVSDSNHNERTEWHKMILDIIKAHSFNTITTENDYMWNGNLHNYNNVDLLSIHSLGDIKCDGHDDWYGTLNYNYLKNFNKPILFDNDGLWICRDKISNTLAWADLVWNDTPRSNITRIYGAKGPFYGDRRWEELGVPVLQGLNTI